MHIPSEYCFISNNMSYTISTGNDHLHIMGNRNEKPLDNVFRKLDDVHDSNANSGGILKSNMDSRQVQDHLVQPNNFPTPLSAAGMILNQCMKTVTNSITPFSSVSSHSSDVPVSTMMNQSQASANTFESIAYAALNPVDVITSMNCIDGTRTASPVKPVAPRTSLLTPKGWVDDYVDADSPRIVYTPEHMICLRQLETCVDTSIVNSSKLRDNVVGHCYAIENSPLANSVSNASCGKGESSRAPASDRSVLCEDKNFTVGKKYIVTKEDGKVVEGVFDGKYLVVADASCAKSAPVSLSQTSLSMPESINDAYPSRQTKSEGGRGNKANCHVKLEQSSKRIKLQSDEEMQAHDGATTSCGVNKSAFYGSTVTPSKGGPRQRRNLQHPQVATTVIEIDHDDDKEMESVENVSSSVPSAFDLSTYDDKNQSENEEYSEALMEINVNTAEFRGKCCNPLSAVFYHQKIVLRTGVASATLRVRDISSIKCNLSTSADIMSSVNIHVLPSFKDTFMAANTKPGAVDELVLFFESKPCEFDSINTVVQIFDSQLPETNETSPVIERRRAIHSSSALHALQEYNNCDDTSDTADDDQVTILKSPEEAILVSNCFTAEIVKLFIYPPPPAVGGITVTNEDLFCLNDGEFLNDVIIEFYIKYLQTEILTPYQLSRTHIFNTFFYGQLTKGGRESSDGLSVQQRRHSQVKRWTKHVDLFSKDFIIIPINEDLHWFLAIICFPYLAGTKQSLKAPATKNSSGHRSPQTELSAETLSEDEKYPCILIFDSLKGGSNRWTVAIILRDYLQIEWDLKKAPIEGPRRFEKSSFKGATPNSPQQMNSSDCGIYLLHYIENFYKRPLTNYALPIRYLGEWFPSSEIATKRRAIRNLIVRLTHQLNPSLDYNPANDGCDID